MICRRTFTNEETGESLRLTVEELDIIKRIHRSEYADAGYDPYEPYVDFFTGQVLTTPVRKVPEPKRRNLPSHWEALRIQKIVKAIRRGHIRVQRAGEQDEQIIVDTAYDMWSGETDAAVLARQMRHIEAPRLALPDHRESYNPPIEYLLTDEEKTEWEAMDPEDRPYNYIPQKYPSLRLVPAYANTVKERFGRCLDLLLCPRSNKHKIVMNPDDLLPALPDPRELRPFPTTRSIDFVGHTASITSIAVDPSGQWLLSASRDGSVRMWDSQTGHCRYVWTFNSSNDDNTPICITWNPNKSLFILAVAHGCTLSLIVPPSTAWTESTHHALEELFSAEEESLPVKSILKWTKIIDDQEGKIFSIHLPAPIIKIQWHRRGDYFATLCPMASSGAQMLHVHQLSRRSSQTPFAKMPGIMRSLTFHPTRPELVLATNRAVRLYDLVKHQLIKKLVSGSESLVDVVMHPSGDHVVAVGHDEKVIWWDLDYSIRPYRTLTNHRGAVRSVAIHPTFPLLASAGDDGLVQVIHATVYADLSANPLLVPVKTIREFEEHTIDNDCDGSGAVAVTKVVFHPTQPWLFAATSSGRISLFV